MTKTQISKLGQLIELLKTKDHWECLNTLSQSLTQGADIIDNIAHNMELKEVGKSRKELPSTLVRSYILMEAIKVKLSILPDEYNKTLDEVIEIMIKENETFDSMEF